MQLYTHLFGTSYEDTAMGNSFQGTDWKRAAQWLFLAAIVLGIGGFFAWEFGIGWGMGGGGGALAAVVCWGGAFCAFILAPICLLLAARATVLWLWPWFRSRNVPKGPPQKSQLPE